MIGFTLKSHDLYDYNLQVWEFGIKFKFWSHLGILVYILYKEFS